MPPQENTPRPPRSGLLSNVFKPGGRVPPPELHPGATPGQSAAPGAASTGVHGAARTHPSLHLLEARLPTPSLPEARRTTMRASIDTPNVRGARATDIGAQAYAASRQPRQRPSEAAESVDEIARFMEDHGLHSDERWASVKLPTAAPPTRTDMKLMLDWMYMHIDPNYVHRGLGRAAEVDEMLKNIHYPYIDEVRSVFNAGNKTKPVTRQDWRGVVRVLAHMKQLLELSENLVDAQPLEDREYVVYWLEEYLVEAFAAQNMGSQAKLQRFDESQKRSIHDFCNELERDIATLETDISSIKSDLGSLDQEERSRKTTEERAANLKNDEENLKEHRLKVSQALEEAANSHVAEQGRYERAQAEKQILYTKCEQLQQAALDDGLDIDSLNQKLQVQHDISAELEEARKASMTVGELVNASHQKLEADRKDLADQIADYHRVIGDDSSLRLDEVEVESIVEVINSRLGSLESSTKTLKDTISTLYSQDRGIRDKLAAAEQAQRDFQTNLGQLGEEAELVETFLENARADHEKKLSEINERWQTAVETNRHKVMNAAARNKAARQRLATAEAQESDVIEDREATLDPEFEHINRDYATFLSGYAPLGETVNRATVDSNRLLDEIVQLRSDMATLSTLNDTMTLEFSGDDDEAMLALRAAELAFAQYSARLNEK